MFIIAPDPETGVEVKIVGHALFKRPVFIAHGFSLLRGSRQVDRRFPVPAHPGQFGVDAECPVKTAVVNISGSGDARLRVSEALDVTITGSGDVEYHGDPQVNSNISGSGKVRKI